MKIIFSPQSLYFSLFLLAIHAICSYHGQVSRRLSNLHCLLHRKLSPSLTGHWLCRELLWWKAIYKQRYLEEIKASKLLIAAMKEPFTEIWRKLQRRHIKGWVCLCCNGTPYFTKTEKKQSWQAKYFSGIFSSSKADGTFWFQIPRTHIDLLPIDFGMKKGEESWSLCACN